MDEPAKYPVGTIFEMAAIPKEARSRFLAEIPAMLDVMDELKQMQALVTAISGGVAELTMQTPYWIDDDKATETISVEMPDGEKFTRTRKIKEPE